MPDFNSTDQDATPIATDGLQIAAGGPSAAPEIDTALPSLRGPLLAWALLSLAWGMSITVTPLFYHNLSLAAGVIGWLTTIQGVGVVAGAPLARVLVDRIGPRGAFVGASLGYAVIVSVLGLLESAWTIGGQRWLDGVLAVIVTVAMEVVLGRGSSMGRARRLGSMAAVGAAGLLIGAMAANAAYAFISIPMLFVASGGVAVICAMVAGKALDPRSLTADAATEGASADFPEPPVPRAKVIRRGWPAIVTAAGWGAFQTTWIVMMPLAAMEHFGLSPGQVLWLPPLHLIGIIAGTPFLVKRWPGLPGLGFVSAICVVATALLLFVEAHLWVWVLTAVIGAASTAVQVRSLSTLLDAVEQPISTVGNELNAMAIAGGRIVGPLVFGIALEMGGPLTMVGSISVLWAFCSCMALGASAYRARASVT